MRRSGKRITSYVVLVVVIGASARMAYGAVAGPSSASGGTSNTRTVSVARGTVTQTVSASGNLEPAVSTAVDFEASGTITAIDVTEGQQVSAGDVLATLDDSNATATLEVAHLNLDAANTKLAQAEKGTSNGQSPASSDATDQAQLHADEVASADAQQAATVNAQGYQLAVDQANQQLVSDQQTCAGNQQARACNRVDDDQRSLDAANQAQAAGVQQDQQAVHAAQDKVDLDRAQIADAAGSKTTAATTVDAAAVDNAKAAVIQAQAAVTTAQKALDACTLLAPAAGTVTAISKAVGDAAGSSGANQAATDTAAAFLTIIDPTAFQVSVGFPESDAVKVKVGQTAVTTLDALSGTELTGTVESIAATATVTSNVVEYDAVVSVIGAPADARAGMTANVTVTTVEKDNVLAVATAAISTQAGASFVDKLVGGRTERTPVTVGIQGDSTTEIVSGVGEGDQLVVSTGTVSSSAATRTGTGGGSFTGGAGGGGFFGGGGGGGGPVGAGPN
jgi:multidrug efflux pump subunit AcrA (membrane-fusion protein)